MGKTKRPARLVIRTHEENNAEKERREWSEKHYTDDQLADPMICPRSLARKIREARRGEL
jgi:hypothetical protein